MSANEGGMPVDPKPTVTMSGVGTQIGPYRIEGPLGAGGMGQVYRARDTRLGRPVALKFLAASQAASKLALERFQREARVISALNHSNVCTIYDIGEERGHPFLVMELLEGQDLRQRIAGERMDPAAILAIGSAVCEGLEAAHSRGIVHRDVKPANIFLTREGGVKVLDFGLAKPAAPENGSITETGLTVGTLAYMAPEQARGGDVDARADLFSLGVVLYEMATGVQPFEGSTPALVFDAILNRAPRAASEVNPRLPPELGRIISKALQKDRALRYQTAADFKADLRLAEREGAAAGGSRGRRGIYATVFASAVLAIAAGYFWFRSSRPTPPGVSHWTELTTFERATQPALSPDGRMLAFLDGGTFTGKAEIYVKFLPDGTPKQLTHDGTTKGFPVFSPDGTNIAYTVVTEHFNWDTWIVPVLGGEPRRWLPNASGLKWIDGENLLFSEITAGVHMLLSTATQSRTNSRLVYDPPLNRGMVHRSSLSPDHKWVVLAEMENSGWLPCRVVPFAGTNSGRQVGPAGAGCIDATWSPDGQWIYLNSNAGGAFHIWRQPFPRGDPAQITFGPTNEQGLWMAPDGKSLLTSAGIGHSQVWIHSKDGDRQIPTEGSASIPIGSTAPAHVFSPDGRKVYYLLNRGVSATSRPELWTADLNTDSSESLFPGVTVTGFDIGPDGQQVAYVSPDNAGKPHLWLARLDRRKSPRQIGNLEADEPFFANDGTLFFRAVENRSNSAYRLDSQGRPQKAIPEPIVGFGGPSADAQWLTVQVSWPDEEVPRMWVAYPLSGGRPAPICAVCWPKWSRDGRYLYVQLSPSGNSMGLMMFYAIQLPAGSILPKIPNGLITPDNIRSLPIAVEYRQEWTFPAADPATYVFVRSASQRNIYRIPLP